MASAIDRIWEDGYKKIMSDPVARAEQMAWIKEASEETGISQSGICKASRGEKPSAGGYLWKTISHTKPVAKISRKENKSLVASEGSLFKPWVRAWDYKTHKTIADYERIVDAAKALGISPEGIGKCLDGTAYSFKGYGFRYVKNPMLRRVNFSRI